MKLGGMLERLTIAMQQAEGSYRGELTTLPAPQLPRRGLARRRRAEDDA